jgi:hypothetical protein
MVLLLVLVLDGMGSGIGLSTFMLWSGKVVRQPLFSSLLGNHSSGKIVRQSYLLLVARL